MKTKRILATLLAAATLTVGMGSIAVNAEESEAVSADMAALSDVAANVGIAEEVDALIDEGQLSAADASMLAQILANNDSEPFYYVNYNKLATRIPMLSDGTVAQHGLAFMNIQETESCYFRLYLNKNYDSNDATSAKNYGSLAGNVTVTPLGNFSTENTANSRCYRVYLGVDGSVPAYSNTFYYLLSSDFGKLKNETQVFQYTQRDSSSTLITNYDDEDNEYVFKKCIFVRGDVNRDGVINNTDSELVLKEVVKLGESDPSRSANNGKLDQQAFRLAADYNGDGDVDIMDVIGINKMLMK